MKIEKITLLVILSVAIIAAQSYAAKDRLGTAGAPELLIPFGSRGVALGGGTVSDASGTEAIYYNPAGIATVQNVEAMFSHLDYIADMNFNVASIVFNGGSYGAIGLSLRALSIGEIEKTTEDYPNGTGQIIDPTFLILGLTYSKTMTDRINVGSTISYINETLENESAKGLCFDFGIQYNLPLEGLHLGITLKNLGPDMRFDGSDLGYVVQIPGTDPNASPKTTRLRLASFNLPTYVQFGLAYKYQINSKNVFGIYPAFTNHSFSAEEYNIGLEYIYNDMLYLRGGYKYADQTDYLWDAFYGFGIKYSSVIVDYSYGKITDYFDDTQWITVKFAF